MQYSFPEEANLERCERKGDVYYCTVTKRRQHMPLIDLLSLLYDYISGQQ